MSLAENIAVVRRLAAILAADVTGYSRLMGADEERTLARLKSHRRELIDPKIREHRGRIVKTTGDGILVEFASVVDAVRCAAEIQRAMLDREAEIEEDRRIRFRMGINLGDIIADGDDIFGDGVNIAARLEALSAPGGICVSRTVRNQVRDKLPYAFEDLGEQSVKNIARPVRVDALGAAEIAAMPLVPVQARHAAQTRPRRRWIALISAGLILLVGAGAGAWWVWPRYSADAPKSAPRLSIVVLPFANLSNDPEQEYFVDAITDNLTTDLTRITGSFVIARNTAFSYKGRAVDVKQIGGDLGVRYVLEGSVRRLGEQVQINVQLIDAETGAHVWADRFDTERTNLAKAQDEIVVRLARALRQELFEVAAHRMESEKPVNPDASDFVMRGWAWYRRTNNAENLLSAQRAFERALEIDPDSVDARAGLAWTITEFVANARPHIVDGVKISHEEDLARAERLLREASERHRNDIRTLLGLGRLRRLQNRLTEAKIYLEQVITLDHSETTGMLQLGIVLIYLAEPNEALPYLQNVLRLDPKYQNVFFYYFWLGDCYLLLNQPEQAIDSFRKGRAASAGAHGPAIGLAAALGLHGYVDEAKRVLADAIKLRPELNSLKQFALLLTNWNATPEFVVLRQKTWDVGLRAAGLPEE